MILYNPLHFNKQYEDETYINVYGYYLIYEHTFCQRVLTTARYIQWFTENVVSNNISSKSLQVFKKKVTDYYLRIVMVGGRILVIGSVYVVCVRNMRTNDIYVCTHIYVNMFFFVFTHMYWCVYYRYMYEIYIYY